MATIGTDFCTTVYLSNNDALLDEQHANNPSTTGSTILRENDVENHWSKHSLFSTSTLVQSSPQPTAHNQYNHVITGPPLNSPPLAHASARHLDAKPIVRGHGFNQSSDTSRAHVGRVYLARRSYTPSHQFSAFDFNIESRHCHSAEPYKRDYLIQDESVSNDPNERTALWSNVEQLNLDSSALAARTPSPIFIKPVKSSSASTTLTGYSSDSTSFSTKFLGDDNGTLQHPLDDHDQSNNPYLDAPLTDNYIRQSLIEFLLPALSASNLQTRLDWAENVFQLCAVSSAHEERLASLNLRKSLGHQAASDCERILRINAMYMVEHARRQNHNRAFFLTAKYMVNSDQEEQFYLLAYNRGHLRSLFYLGDIFEARQALDEARERYEEGAGRGDAACLYRLSCAYFKGELGLKKSKDKALRFLVLAAKTADADCPEPLYLSAPPSRSKLSFKFHYNRPTLEHNPDVALKNLRRAALLGHASSQLHLGQLYCQTKQGRRTAQGIKIQQAHASGSIPAIETWDSTLALHYLHLAARRGLPEADYEIAHYLFCNTAYPSEEDGLIAYSYARRAVLASVPGAYILMGKAHERGIGCRRNLVLAERYYSDGAKLGDEEARARLGSLRNHGTSMHGLRFGSVGQSDHTC